MRYVDGFVVPVPKRKLAAYRRMARTAGKVWRITARWNTSSPWPTT